MTVRTKPVRIFEADHAPIKLMAELQQQSPADVIHLAVAHYIHSHRDRLAHVFAQTQKAIAAGDLEGLTKLLLPSARAQADELMADLSNYTDNGSKAT
jgi:hypothetical protein